VNFQAHTARRCNNIAGSAPPGLETYQKAAASPAAPQVAVSGRSSV